MIDFTTITTPADPEEEQQLFTNLRAQAWDEFYGQEQIKKALRVALSATKERKEPLDHVLFYGPPGLGKTTLAHLIAKELGSSLKITAGTTLTKAGDLAAIITNLQPGDVLFIDEIHRLPKVVEETLYPVMEDFALDIVIGKGPAARSVRVDVPPCTIVGATTRFGMLAGPFRDRFGLIHHLTHYFPKELSTIISQAATKLSTQITPDAAFSLAKRSRGTPRIALKLLKRVRDFAQVAGSSAITDELVDQALDLYAIDSMGLDHHDRQLLTFLIEKHQGGPVGISTIAATINEDPGTVEEVLEPYLIQSGLLKRTPRGRVVTKSAYEHLGFTPPKDNASM